MTASRPSHLNLGTLLIDMRSQRSVAWSPRTEKLWPDTKSAIADDLASLFPKVTTTEWAKVFSSIDQQIQTLSTSINQPERGEQAVLLVFEPLLGAGQDFLLLTVEHQTANLATILHRDSLTNLPDRNGLAEHYHAWQQSSSVSPLHFALLFMDLDNFKQVNDQHGHTAGDQVLTTLAPRWQSCLREHDLVARYGGDEFVVLLLGIKSRQEIDPVIARLEEATQEPIEVDGHQLSISVTIGIALSNNSPDGNLAALIDAADRDMYAAKKS